MKNCWRGSTWLNCNFWTCWICSEQRWSFRMGGCKVHGDGLIFFFFFPVCFFVCIPLIPCNSTLFYLKNYSNYSWIKRPKIICLFPTVLWSYTNDTRQAKRNIALFYFKNKSILKCDKKNGFITTAEFPKETRDVTTLNRFVTHCASAATVFSIQALSVSQWRKAEKIQCTYIRLNSIDTIHPCERIRSHSPLELQIRIQEKAPGFQSINTNKSKPFLKIKGAVNLQKLYLQLLQRPFEFSRKKKKTHLHTTTTSVYVQLLVYLWFHRCL